MKRLGTIIYMLFNLIWIVAAIRYMFNPEDTQALIIFESNLILSFLQDMRNTNASKDS